MDSNLLIVALLAVGLSMASIFAYIMRRLKLPAILGYLIAGYIIGPFSPGYTVDLHLTEQLAEVGVILMLFGVGMHFKSEDLYRVKNIAIPGAIGQTLMATIVTTIIVMSAGWTIESGIIMGLAAGVASTIVLIRLLSDNHLLNTEKGHIAVGWLIVEDLLTVIILVMLPTLATFSSGEALSFSALFWSTMTVIGKFILLGLIMFTLGHKAIAFILTSVARLRSQEIFTLTMIALVFLIAVGSSLIFGTSIALGAFIAGMVIGKTRLRHQAADNALPLKDIFAVIFFLTVGMLFNPAAIILNLGLFLGIFTVIVIIKPLVACFITLFLGYPLKTALTIAVALAQIGEFSFILAEQASNLKLLPDDGFDILVACAVISIAINQLLFQTIDFIDAKWRKPHHEKIKVHGPISPKVIIAGFGPLGREISRVALHLGLTPLIIEENIDTVIHMEQQNTIIFGDATKQNILKDAQLEKASFLIITIPDIEKIIKVIHAARHINPSVQILVRVHLIADISRIEEMEVEYICTEKVALKDFSDYADKFFKLFNS